MKIQIKSVVMKYIFYILIPFILVGCQESENESIKLYKDKQYERAFPLLKEDAEKGKAQAQFYFGQLYEEGNIVKMDEQKALIWYQKAAEQNNGDAQHALGEAYFYGKFGLKQDLQKAFDFYKKSAESGNVSSQIKL